MSGDYSEYHDFVEGDILAIDEDQYTLEDLGIVLSKEGENFFWYDGSVTIPGHWPSVSTETEITYECPLWSLENAGDLVLVPIAINSYSVLRTEAPDSSVVVQTTINGKCRYQPCSNNWAVFLDSSL